MKLGAEDYVPKPFDNDEIRLVVRRALERTALARENRMLRARLERDLGFENLIGSGPAMRRVFETIQKVAETDLTVLIRGESGTGKELVAQALHQHSARKRRPFVAVNCAAISRELVESELFGHEKGAFTGAEARRVGRFEAARRRHDLPRRDRRHGARDPGQGAARAPGALLRARRRQQAPRGGRARRRRDPPRPRARRARRALPRGPLLPAQGRRARAAAAARAARGRARRSRRASSSSSPSATAGPPHASRRGALAALSRHAWPGNVRELRNVVERAAVLAPGRRDRRPRTSRSRPRARRAERGGRRRGRGGLPFGEAKRSADGALRARLPAARAARERAATCPAPPRRSAWCARACSRRSASSGSATRTGAARTRGRRRTAMTTRRPGLLARLAGLLRGAFTGWLRDREESNPARGLRERHRRARRPVPRAEGGRRRHPLHAQQARGRARRAPRRAGAHPRGRAPRRGPQRRRARARARHAQAGAARGPRARRARAGRAARTRPRRRRRTCCASATRSARSSARRAAPSRASRTRAPGAASRRPSRASRSTPTCAPSRRCATTSRASRARACSTASSPATSGLDGRLRAIREESRREAAAARARRAEAPARRPHPAGRADGGAELPVAPVAGDSRGRRVARRTVTPSATVREAEPRSGPSATVPSRPLLARSRGAARRAAGGPPCRRAGGPRAAPAAAPPRARADRDAGRGASPGASTRSFSSSGSSTGSSSARSTVSGSAGRARSASPGPSISGRGSPRGSGSKDIASAVSSLALRDEGREIHHLADLRQARVAARRPAAAIRGSDFTASPSGVAVEHEGELEVLDPDHVAHLERAPRHLHAVHEGAVDRLEIAHLVAVALAHQHARGAARPRGSRADRRTPWRGRA